MKKIYAAVLLSAVIFFTASCSKEPVNPIEKNFPNTGFTKLKAGYQFIITIAKGTAFSIKANGDETDINDLVMNENGDKLSITYSRCKSNRKRMRLNITMPSFLAGEFSSQSHTDITGFTESKPIVLFLSGQSEAGINCSAPGYAVNVSGQSKIELQGGSGDTINGEASEQSSIVSYGFSVVSASVKATGQSTIKIKVTTSLTADASGQSSIYYQGNPPQKNITQSGGSKVIQE
jgi:hypothetical protein